MSSDLPRLLPGDFLKTALTFPDASHVMHTTRPESGWHEVYLHDVFLVVATGHIRSQVTVLHMRSMRLITTSDVTFWWLQEVEA